MLGGLMAWVVSTGCRETETNPDTNGNLVKVDVQGPVSGQLDPDPDHHFAAVHKQIFAGGTTPSMQGFVQSYFDQQRDVNQSKKIMYYFAPEKLPVLTSLRQRVLHLQPAGSHPIPRADALQPGVPRTTVRRSARQPRRFSIVGVQFKRNYEAPARGETARGRDILTFRCRQFASLESAEPAEATSRSSSAPIKNFIDVKNYLRENDRAAQPIPSSNRNYTDHQDRQRSDLSNASDSAFPPITSPEGEALHRRSFTTRCARIPCFLAQEAALLVV
jgi:hypothetical protein